ncbi:MAG: MgtC/SapB family protein [Bacteroidales bacterium]|nr:MgtC/SapB family protein [Bacteroidales bacterium]
MNLLHSLSDDFINFILVTVLSLLIGLEQRRRHREDKPETLYGTDRTYTFIGILGYVLYILSPVNLLPFLVGGTAIVIFLSIFYLKRIETQKKFGITSMIVVLITYCLGPLLYIKPLWLSILLVVTILILIELKPQFRTLTQRFGNDEFIILAKFLIMAGIILPLLPDKIIIPEIPISPYKIWLAVVVISGISYLSYLVEKFIFPSKGFIITGILGGMYSSTATTVVLARKSKESKNTESISTSIIMATGMMFIRILILAFIFNHQLGLSLFVPSLSLTLISFLVAWFLHKKEHKTENQSAQDVSSKNPLEFKTALIFAVLFIIFALATKYVLNEFGTKGLDILSWIVGVTDIDPFLLGMFTGKFNITLSIITHATLIAMTSNNLIKLAYALFWSSKKIWPFILTGFTTIILVSIIFIVFW